jgi:hypothetical protein
LDSRFKAVFMMGLRSFEEFQQFIVSLPLDAHADDN